MSLIRKIDGQDGNNDYYDFVLTGTITKGQSNIISNTTLEGEKIEQVSGSSKIIINELLPNPTGADDEEEWIELKNISTETISLIGWKLGDASTKRYEIKQGSISTGGFIFFKRSMTGIALNNTGGDEVGLYNASGTKLDSIKYTGSANEGESYAKRDDNSWTWSIKLTPGAKNIVEGKSAAPIIAIDTDTEVAVGDPVVFDASDTTDPEGDEITFVWDFADGDTDDGVLVEHRFAKEGIYTIKLVATDKTGNKAEKSVIITVKNAVDFLGGISHTAVENIKISEFVPNPAGSDTTEFIELFNPTDEDIDLSGLKLDDEEGGSRAYTIPEGTVIAAGEYKIFGKQDTKLALNNTSDSVRILYPDGTILTEVSYDDVPEGSGYIQDAEENWIWTGEITPGEANIISAPKAVAGVKISKSKSKYVKAVINTTLEKIRDEDVGDKVTVAGVVAVEPGVLGTQYFYIVGSPGVQVYMYKKDFPDLNIGDRVEVTGEITETSGNTRIKLAQKEDIKIIDHPGDPVPENAEISDVGEPAEGRLIQVNGEVTEVKSSYLYVDDGTAEIKIYFKRGAGIKSKLIQPGDIVSVTGIVEQTKDGYQVLPRSQTDIVKTGVAEDAVTKTANQKVDNQREVAEKYLTATAGGLTAILIGLFLQARGAVMLAWVKRVVRRK
jgi:PKD repeat protein